MTAQDLLLAIAAAPTLVAGAAAVAARAIGANRARVRDGVLALGLAGGFALGLWWLGVRPSLPLAPYESAWSWVLWIAAAGAVLGALSGLVRRSAALHFIDRWAYGTAAVWLVLAPLAPHRLTAFEAFGRAAAWGAGSAFLATALVVHARRESRPASYLPLLLAFLAAATLLLEGGLAPPMADAALALGAATMATVFCARLRSGPPLPAAAGYVVAPAFTALLAAGHGYLNAGPTVRIPVIGPILVLAAASAVLIPRPRWAFALALVLAVGACLLVLRFDEGFLLIDGL